MKLTTLLKEIQEEQKNEFEFAIDPYGNLEIWSAEGVHLLAVVDKESGNIDYNQIRMHDIQLSKNDMARIKAAADKFLDDESDPSDPTAMYADRMGPSKKKPGSKLKEVQTEAEGDATSQISKKMNVAAMAIRSSKRFAGKSETDYTLGYIAGHKQGYADAMEKYDSQELPPVPRGDM